MACVCLGQIDHKQNSCNLPHVTTYTLEATQPTARYALRLPTYTQIQYGP